MAEAPNSGSIRAEFAQCLRDMRILRGFRTARSFARALAIDENRYSRYERAEVEPDFALLLQMCEALDVTPNDLLGERLGHRPGVTVGGFAEAPADIAGTASPTPRAGLRRRQSLAWQFARAFADVEDLPAGAAASEHGLDRIRRITRLFQAIEDDPFGTVPQLVADPRTGHLPASGQQRLARLADALLNAADQGAGETGLAL